MAKVPGAKSLSRVARRVFGDVKEVPQIVHEGRRALHTGGGTHSMFLWPFLAALRKLKGKGKIDQIVYGKYLRRLKNADEKLGKILAQHGPSEKLFTVKETVPAIKRIKGLPASVEYETYSALAPVTKASKAATPFLAGMYLSEKLSPGEKRATMETRQLMKKAADIIGRHRRREEAVKLAMLMVERGKCEPFSSLAELEEKVAALEAKNLEAVKEALEMDSDLTDFGKVASPSVEVPKGSSKAEANFFHRLSE